MTAEHIFYFTCVFLVFLWKAHNFLAQQAGIFALLLQKEVQIVGRRSG